MLDGRWGGLLRELRGPDGPGLLRDIMDLSLLCEQLRPRARTLVDAFAIPAPFLVPASLDGGEVTG